MHLREYFGFGRVRIQTAMQIYLNLRKEPNMDPNTGDGREKFSKLSSRS
jgi:hypothetical protein